MARAAEQKPSPILDAMRQIREDAASYRGIWSWITTVDHKRIGIMYGVTALGFFLLGGIEALLIRLQLSTPNGRVLDPDQYNRIFTMHGTTMIFLVVMPLSAAFFNLMTPLMIGARDVAFPRLNSFSYWVFLAGGIFMNASFFTGGNILQGELGAPDAGWFGYAPLTLSRFSPGEGVDFWALGLQILGIASMASGFNFIFAMPVITVALFQLLFDRLYDANFFNVDKGGTPLLWQHMFWLFGHPEVYILILPAMGIVSEVLPTFARKP